MWQIIIIFVSALSLVESQTCSLSCHQNGRHPNPNDRHSYIECTNGKASLVKCPLSGDGYNQLIFDGHKQNCGEQYTCSEPNGKYTHPHKHHLFYSCKNGVPSIEHCPVGHIFSSTLKGCFPQFECPELSGNFAHPTNKSQYYKCCFGESKLYFCPLNYVYEQGSLCVPVFQCPQLDGKYRNIRNENQYYDCINGNPILKTCPSKQIFDGLQCVEKFECPLPEGKFVNRQDKTNRTYYLCKNNVGIKTQCPDKQVFYGELCEQLFRCPKPNGRFANPRDHHKYYKCENDYPYPHQCPNGQEFSEVRQECQRQFQCPAPNGRFKHEDRTKYYECVGYKPIIKHCTRGKLFDGTKCVRERKDEFQCTSVGTFKHPTDRNKYYYCGHDLIAKLQECSLGWAYNEGLMTCVKSQFHCPRPDGLFGHPHDDRYYFECHSNVAQLTPCPLNKKFDRYRLTCVDTTTTPQFNCPQPDGLFSHPSNRTRFYYCRGGQPNLRHCGINKIFDQNIKNCIDLKPTYECPHSSGWFPYPGDDRRYYQCRDSIPHLIDCPTGHRFNPTDLRCKDSDRDDRVYRCPTPEGLFPYPSNPLQYYRCQNNVWSLEWCPTGQRFDGSTYRCITPLIPSDQISETNFRCPKPNGLFKHPTNQSRFFNCVNNQAQLRQCLFHHIFDEDTNQCIPWSWPTTFYCPLPNGLFIDHQNNSQYYECCNGRSTLRSCPNNQIFNGRHCISEVVYSCENTGKKQWPISHCYNGHRYQYSCPYLYGTELIYNGYRCVQPYLCPLNSGIHIIQNPVHSQQYYKCVEGVPSLYTCSRGFSYDQRRGCCVYDESQMTGYFGYRVDDRTDHRSSTDRGRVNHRIPGVVVIEPITRSEQFTPKPEVFRSEWPTPDSNILMTEHKEQNEHNEHIPTIPVNEPTEVRHDFNPAQPHRPPLIEPEITPVDEKGTTKTPKQDYDDNDQDGSDDDYKEDDYKEEDEDNNEDEERFRRSFMNWQAHNLI